jgi:transaldolase/glucose-6-phosphate isomerase
MTSIVASAAAQARGVLREALAAHLARLEPGDYFALNAYLASSEENDEDLQAIRTGVRDRHHVATTLGYGPRFLHSTGQLHKGGPNTGVYLQLTAEDPDSLPIPGLSYSMGVLARAQAQGDFAVLVERGRRAFWLHLSDPRAGLARLRDWLT